MTTWASPPGCSRGAGASPSRRTGRLRDASRELGCLRAQMAEPGADVRPIGGNSTGALLAIAEAVLAGELAAERGRFDEAVAQLHRGVLLQENLIYIEPSDWYAPVRQHLGAVLLRAGRPAEAEAVYWQDLKENPENGWSLFGLAESLAAQGREEEAAAIRARFERAWARADVTLPASRF